MKEIGPREAPSPWWILDPPMKFNLGDSASDLFKTMRNHPVNSTATEDINAKNHLFIRPWSSVSEVYFD